MLTHLIDACSPHNIRDNKVHWANMGPTWVLSAPDGPHVGPMNLLSGMYKITRLQSSRIWNLITYMKIICHGPLTRYVKLQVAHAPGMPGTFSPPPTSKEAVSKRSQHASRHVRHARAVMHVGIANPRWRGKRSRHSRRMRNPQFYLFGKRPIIVVDCP